MIRRAKLNVKPNLAKKQSAPAPSTTAAIIASIDETTKKGTEERVEEEEEEEEEVEEDFVPPSPRKSVVHFALLPAPSPSILQSHTPIRPTRTPTPSATRAKKVFTGHERLDPKTFTMADMISWNPKWEQGLLTPGHEGKRNNRGRKRSKQLHPPSPTKKTETHTPTPSTSMPTAPQVKIGADGTLILDEESLTIRREHPADAANWETVEEGRAPKKISSMSFRKREWRKGSVWSEEENDLFFKVLSATGTDFSLMQHFIACRTRAELKNKYNREERNNAKRLNDALTMPSTLDESLYALAKHTEELLEEKKRLESVKKQKVKKTVPRRAAVEVDWDEKNADLEAEARDEIARLAALDEMKRNRTRSRLMQMEEIGASRSTKASLVGKVLDAVQSEAMRRQHQQLRTVQPQQPRQAPRGHKSYSPIGLPLGADFPPFEIVPTTAAVVSIAPNPVPGQPPVVYLPHNSELKVIAATERSSARVLFICPPLQIGGDKQEYVLQHQRAVDNSSSDFLHLFGNVAAISHATDRSESAASTGDAEADVVISVDDV